MRKMKIYTTISTKFEAAHCLCLPEKGDEENEKLFGKCSNLHGHNYKLEVSVSGDIKDDGMVINFKRLKEIINKNVTNYYDHQFINELMDKVPTAENMCIEIVNKLQKAFSTEDINLEEIKLYETDTSYCKVRCKDEQ